MIDILSCAQIVPTNTTDEWYTQLRTLGNDRVTLSFSQSKDEFWIRIDLRYKIVAVSPRPKQKSRFLRYRVTTIDTPAIIETQATIRDHILFVTEKISTLRISNELLPEGHKVVGLVFSRKGLTKQYEKIKESLENIIVQLTDETELLREDQLARGKLVNVSVIDAEEKRGENSTWWTIKDSLLESQQPTGELPEYWGKISSQSDFISDTEDYPWMPVKVSEMDIPF